MLVSQNLSRRLHAYRPVRDGYDIPGTSNGPLYEAACWNYAVAGGAIAVHDWRSGNRLYSAILPINEFEAPPQVTGFNDIRDQFAANCGAFFDRIRDNWVNAQAGDNDARRTCAKSLLCIFASANGLTPVYDPAGQPYRLHSRTEWYEWSQWHHFGLSLQMPDPSQYNVIQTITNTEVDHSCTTVWDEGMPEFVIGLQGGFLAAHVANLQNVPLAPLGEGRCTVQNCYEEHSGWRSIWNHWHRCETCGTIHCPQHLPTAVQAHHSANSTGSCQKAGCNGETRRIS